MREVISMDKVRILIVDDDPGLRKTLVDILTVKGFEVLTAKNGAEGLGLLQENPVNLLIIDLGLPDIPGLEVLNRVKTAYPATEAIILTGNASLDSAIEATNRGAFSYLIKPYEIEQLLLQIRRAAEKQKTHETLREALQSEERRSAELAAANKALEIEVGERRHTEEALRRSNRTHRMLSECNEALVYASGEAELLDKICRTIVEIGCHCLAWVGYGERVGAQEMYPVARAMHGVACPATSDNVCGGGEKGLCSVASDLLARDVVGDRIPLDRVYGAWLDEGLPCGCASAIAFPLKGAGGVFGALNIHAGKSTAFDAEEIKLLTELANDLSYGIMSLRSNVERRHAENDLRQRQRAIESSSNGIMIADANAPEYPITYVNPAFERITGYAGEDVLGRNGSFMLGNDREQLGLQEILAALREEREGNAVLRNYRKDGSLFWNELSISPVRDESGHVSHFVGIINDITERKLYEEQLEYQANHDGLTALPNRNLLADRIGQALTYAERYRKLVAVLFVDLDHFKFINDSLGHDMGDRLLQVVGRRLTECVRSIDTVARHGGDEFVLVLPDLTESEDAVKVAQKMQDAVGRPFKIGEHEFVVSCSTGISIYPKDGEDAQTLLKNADAAMYRAKENGRNNFQFFTSSLNDRIVARLAMEKHLRMALERDEFVLHYQPQVDLRTGRITGMESLIRWNSPELGFIPPDSFISLAEETGLIVPIGEWVIRTSCAQNKAWQDAGLAPLVMAINLSPRQFREEGLAESIAAIVQDTGLEPRYLELEIIESLVMHDVDSALAILRKLKELGAQLTMDDFGTGYSSLSYLKRFPFDKMKIDKSFVRDITSDPDSAAITRAIITMAHSLNLRVIAEGIETEGQLAYLTSQNCDEMQGFYFSRPVPAPEFEKLMRAKRQLEITEESDRAGEGKLLIVDDEAHVITALERILNDEGYDILTANSAMEGFELLAINRVGVIVSDLCMPGMSGTDFLGRVKEIHPDIVRIMLSGRADMDSLGDAVNRGAIFRFLVKPWEDDLLRENVMSAFRQYKLLSARNG